MATTENIAAMPQITLQPGMIVRFSAIDAATGAAVTGVTVSAVNIYGETQASDNGSAGVTPVPPLFAYGADTQPG